MEVGIGDVIADKYRVESLLGRGGMGYVVAANHTQLERAVAIKLLYPDYCASPEAIARFLNEARACARIESEHVAKVLDMGMLDDGDPYMVMELLEGQDLARELGARGMLSVEDAIDYVLQVSEALAEAHALGIVHRDLKPANLFKTRRTDGTTLIKVLDFGISKVLDNDDQAPPSLTRNQDLVGSPAYMSPEQVRNPKAVDVRSDLWSLGILLHEFLGGRAPFMADAPFSLLASVVSDPPESLRLLRPNLTEELYIVVSRCLEKDPAKRYQEVLELVEALTPCAPEAARNAFSRISAIVRSAKHRAQLRGPKRMAARAAESPPEPVSVPIVPPRDGTLQSPMPTPRARADAKAKWVVNALGSESGSAPAGNPRRSRRHLLAIGIALTVGVIGTIMAQRTRASRAALEAPASRAEPVAHPEGEARPAFTAEPLPAAPLKESRDDVAAAPSVPVEPANAARIAVEAPKTARRTIRQKAGPPPTVPDTASVAAETASAPTTLSRPH